MLVRRCASKEAKLCWDGLLCIFTFARLLALAACLFRLVIQPPFQILRSDRPPHHATFGVSGSPLPPSPSRRTARRRSRSDAVAWFDQPGEGRQSPVRWVNIPQDNDRPKVTEAAQGVCLMCWFLWPRMFGVDGRKDCWKSRDSRRPQKEHSSGQDLRHAAPCCA